MITTKLTRRVVLAVGIPAALASGAIAAAASSTDSPATSGRATTTITQTAPGSNGVVSVRGTTEDVRGNGDENELRGRANEPGEDVRGNADEREHQNEPDGDHGRSGPGGGDDSNRGHDRGGSDDPSGHDRGDDHGGSRHGGDDHGGDD